MIASAAPHLHWLFPPPATAGRRARRQGEGEARAARGGAAWGPGPATGAGRRHNCLANRYVWAYPARPILRDEPRSLRIAGRDKPASSMSQQGSPRPSPYRATRGSRRGGHRTLGYSAPVELKTP